MKVKFERHYGEYKIKMEDDTPSLEEIEEKENDDFGNSEVEETEKDNKKNKKVK